MSKEEIYDMIKRACDERRRAKFFPYALSFPDLKILSNESEESLKTQINVLFKEKRIKFYRNVNRIVFLYIDKYF